MLVNSSTLVIDDCAIPWIVENFVIATAWNVRHHLVVPVYWLIVKELKGCDEQVAHLSYYTIMFKLFLNDELNYTVYPGERLPNAEFVKKS